MISLLVGDIYTDVKNIKGNTRAISAIQITCRARPNGYKFMPKYKRGMWDGYITLTKGFGKFPTGLLTKVIEEFDKQEIAYQILYSDDEYKNLDFIEIPAIQSVDKHILDGIELRDYQINNVIEMIKKRRGIVKMATGAGKTEIMAAVLKALDLQSVTIVHRKELMYQTAERYEKRGLEDIGYIGDGKHKEGKHIVAMIQTLSRHFEKYNLDDNKIVFVDECHTAGNTNTALDVLSRLQGRYRFGMSGTPLKYQELADLKLVAYTGDLICEIDNEFMIESGYSAKPIIEFYEIIGDPAWYETQYQFAVDDLIVNNKKRNEIIVDKANNSDGICLIIVDRIEHANILGELISNSYVITGSNNMDYRNNMLEYMRNNDRGVFIATKIWDEGVDVPSIDTVILASGGKSYVKLLQRIGRGLRKKEGKENVLHVVDFYDRTNKYLESHSEERMYTLEQEKLEIEVIK